MVRLLRRKSLSLSMSLHLSSKNLILAFKKAFSSLKGHLLSWCCCWCSWWNIYKKTKKHCKHCCTVTIHPSKYLYWNYRPMLNSLNFVTDQVYFNMSLLISFISVSDPSSPNNYRGTNEWRNMNILVLLLTNNKLWLM